MVWEYDSILHHVLRRETRDGTKMIAKQMLKLIQHLHEIDLLADYQAAYSSGQELWQSRDCLCSVHLFQGVECLRSFDVIRL